jgi:hypothetical protein
VQSECLSSFCSEPESSFSASLTELQFDSLLDVIRIIQKNEEFSISKNDFHGSRPMEKLVISHSPHCRLRCQRFTAGNLGFALGYLRSSAFAASVQFCAAIVFKNIRRYRSLRIKHGNIIERPVAWALVLTISLLPLAASCQLVAHQRMAPEAVGGVLNLSGWDFVTDGPVNLSGEWEFYWQQHLEPHDFARSNPPPRTGFIRLPGYWNGYDVDGKTLSGDGYATYRLRVQLKPANRHIALRLLACILTVKRSARHGLLEKIDKQQFPATVPRSSILKSNLTLWKSYCRYPIFITGAAAFGRAFNWEANRISAACRKAC